MFRQIIPLTPVSEGQRTMSRRGTGEGTVFQRGDGRWVGKISLGLDAQGRRRQSPVDALTQADISAKLDDLKQKRKTHAKSLSMTDTLAAYLSRWISNDVMVNSSGKTLVEYESAVKLHIAP